MDIKNRLETAVKVICKEIPKRINHCDSDVLTEKEIWGELVCCILSSQVQYEVATAATKLLAKSGLIGMKKKYCHDVHIKKIRMLLSTPFKVKCTYTRYRFPNKRAEQIADVHIVVAKHGGSLKRIIFENNDSLVTREFLIKKFPGIGPKQASMFLRNTGASYDLAILDKHVLHYMEAININNRKTNLNKKEYLNIENKLVRYANELGYPVGFVDWAIWIVMRVASREGYI